MRWIGTWHVPIHLIGTVKSQGHPPSSLEIETNVLFDWNVSRFTNIANMIPTWPNTGNLLDALTTIDNATAFNYVTILLHIFSNWAPTETLHNLHYITLHNSAKFAKLPQKLKMSNNHISYNIKFGAPGVTKLQHLSHILGSRME